MAMEIIDKDRKKLSERFSKAYQKNKKEREKKKEQEAKKNGK